jgi:hypothetical protein
VAPRVAVTAFVLATASSCTRYDPPPAAAPAASPAKAEWRVECRAMADDRFQACYGPGWDGPPPRVPGRFDFYQVSVERRQGSEASHVLFVKRLGIRDVDARLLADGFAGEVARYDAATRSVRFDVSREPLVFALDAER